MNPNSLPLHSTSAPQEEPAAYRKVLLRVVFWALGLAACFGALGIIFAGHDTLWRIVGTCAATGIGALLILAVSAQLDREMTRRPGLMLIALIVIEYLGTLGLIWSLFKSAEEPVGGTMAFLAATAIPAIVFSALTGRAGAEVAGRVGVVTSSAVFVLLLVGAWGGWLQKVKSEHWFLIGLWLAAFGLLSVVCLIGTGTDRRHWRWLGIAAAAASFAMCAYATWWDIHDSSAMFVCVVSVAAVVAHANAMAWCPLKQTQRWLQWGTIGAGIVTGLLVDLAKITNPWQAEFLGRLAGATAIIGGCGTLAVLILAKINQRSLLTPVALTKVRGIKLTCPRCGTKQVIAIGSGECKTCGVVIQIQILPVALEHPMEPFNELSPEMTETALHPPTPKSIRP
jgi:hypothetical protein